MHATRTLDYAVVLSGEITLILDQGEVTLKPFDTVVQRGTNHTWENRGTEPALIAFCLARRQAAGELISVIATRAYAEADFIICASTRLSNGSLKSAVSGWAS